jgi:multidrug efflux pump subunit AcrA (membrane-fusion protein)
MEKRRETGSRITAFLAGAGLVSLIVTLSFVWRPAREKLAFILNPGPASPATPAPTTDSSGRKILYYDCPMHPWYKSHKPGICPECGMKLVAVYAEEEQAAPASAARLAPTTGSSGQKVLYYDCPMHPWYKSHKPGICPECGMKLVAVYADEQQSTAAGPLPPGMVQISPARQQLMGVTTAVADYRPIEKTIRTVGQVAIDETRLSVVRFRSTGWIQKVFVNYTGQSVQKGEPLFTIDSPDLLATEQEFLLAIRARKALAQSPLLGVASGSEFLLEAARRRLALADLTDSQIKLLEGTGKRLGASSGGSVGDAQTRALEGTGKAQLGLWSLSDAGIGEIVERVRNQRAITIYAPASGYVVDRKSFPYQYVTPDTELYKLADLSTVWVQADVYEFEMPAVSLGQEATLTTESLPGTSWKGRLVFINPEVKTDTRTGTVRMEFANPELKLKPGMFVKVELHKSFGRQLTVPVDAVLNSGTRQVVFVDLSNGAFAPREVKVGEGTEDYIAILSGLRAGERVVTRANFLINSESNLRQSIEGMADMPGVQPKGQEQAKDAMPPEHRH